MDPLEAILKTPFPGYEWPLTLARNLARSRNQAQMEQAVKLLAGLTRRYPTALAVGQEYVLALIEAGKSRDAEQELSRLEDLFQGLDMELLCRWGRYFKDKGDYHSGSKWVKTPGPENRDLAITHYEKSITKYVQAYRIDNHYYPGINEAALILIVASLKARNNPVDSLPSEVAELAEKVVKARSLAAPGDDMDEKVWKPATRGEAFLLMQDWGKAAAFYSQALGGDSRLTPHARDAMRKQVHRIAEAFQQFKIPIAAPFDQEEHIDDFFQEDRPVHSASTHAPPAAA